MNRHSGEKPLRATDCYRFVMSHQAVDVCMSGPRNMEERRRALKALQLGPQSAGELKQVQRIGDHVHANYRRFLDKFMPTIVVFWIKKIPDIYRLK